MKKMSLVFIVSLCLFSFASMADDIRVTCDPNAESQVKLACERLREHLKGRAQNGKIVVSRIAEEDRDLGDEGYLIEAGTLTEIDIQANTDAGLANGVYTFLRTLMIDDLDDPFARDWNVRDKPFFRWRSMMVAPYNFGAAHGFSVLSPDMWAFKHWKQYIDYLRLFNLNRLGIYAMRHYDPAIPESIMNKTRYEVWRQAMDYAHELGMKFIWVQTANFVHQETWWRYPELRCEHEIGWAGASLCYSKARDIIRKTQRHTFEYFKDANYIMFMFDDGGGACYCDQCSKDQVGVFLRIMDDIRETLAEVGSDAEIIFWSWVLDFWYSAFPSSIPGYLEKFPQVHEIQEEVYKRLPHDVPFEDISIAPPVFGGRKTDTLKRAREEGFETVINFVYAMGPENARFMFPQARIRSMIRMAQHSKEAGIDGMDGYRLSPSSRVLNDFVFMRLTWNPDLTLDELLDEMAGYLTEKPASRSKAAEAILALENYWDGVDSETNIAKATKLFDELKAEEPSRQLEYVADVVAMLPGVYELGKPELTTKQANAVKWRMFNETRKRYILQGFGGTDIQWTPEALAYFRAYADIWAPTRRKPIPLTDTLKESK